ncbi:hypothetical protein NPIL_110091, partial [Nephila pilipes]
DPCKSDPCKNGGTCFETDEVINEGRSYKCLCTNGYDGPTCEESSLVEVFIVPVDEGMEALVVKRYTLITKRMFDCFIFIIRGKM